MKLHGQDGVSIARILHQRHRKYTEFMHKVARHVVEGYLIHRKLVEMEVSKKEATPALAFYAPPPGNHDLQAVQATCKLNMQGSIKRFKGFHAKSTSSEDV